MVSYSLPSGTILKGTSYSYRIEKTLGQGSFGITYIASVKMAGALGSIDANIKVAIKEFFMRDINGRSDVSVTSGSKDGIYADYKKKFTREAENLSKLQHPNIIKVIESFEANNTIYYVMEYIGGGSLDDYIVKNNALKEHEAIEIVKQIGSALTFMHNNKMLHLDLKPSNIMRKESGDVVLIDFGLSKQYDEKGEPESSTKVGAGTPGYAPLEQANYREGKGFPVTMDVYALGATMFKMLTGVRPPEASDILNDGFPLYELQEHNVSDNLSASIAKAMAPIKKDRCQSVGEFISLLDTEEATIVDVDKIKRSHHKNNNVKKYHILPNTSRVKIEYSPMTPFESGRYIASIGSNDMSLGRFEGSTYLTYPINEGRYKKFLSDLQDLNLSITDERLINYNEFSEEPEKLVISLFDGEGRKYAKYWIAGWENEFGNISGDVQELNKTIITITPHLQDYWSGMYKEIPEKSPIDDREFHRTPNDNGSNILRENISDSKTNPNSQYEIVGLLAKDKNDNWGWRDTQNGCVIVVSKGLVGGEQASKLTVRSLMDYFHTKATESPEKDIIKSIGEAHHYLYLSDLRADCVVSLIKDNKLYWGQVGSYCIYYYNPRSGLTKLSESDNNEIGETMLPPRISKNPILPVKNEILLICTDRLTNVLNENEISEILSENDKTLVDKVNIIKELALQKGSEDNINISAIRFLQVNKNAEKKKEEIFIRYRWEYALVALVIEAGFAYYMLSQSREGDMDSDGRLLAGLYFFASLCCTYYLFYASKNIAAGTWWTITIVFTIACFANSLLLPMWNYSLTGAYFLLSLGLSIVSSFTLLIKKSA